MTDLLLLPLAKASFSCYDDNVNFAWQSKLKLAHVLRTQVDGTLTFAFAGTMGAAEWVVDLLAIPIPLLCHPRLGTVHAGFYMDANAAVTEFILPTLMSLGFPSYYLTGHSKGGGDAVMAHALLKDVGHPPVSTRVFEPPRVGGPKLKEFLSGDDLHWTQTRNRHVTDIVTLVPFGPMWEQPTAPVILTASDDDDLASLHRMPQVIASLTALTI